MSRARAWVAWLPFVLLCAAISTVSHLSEPPLQDLLAVRFMDKVLHACAYSGVGAAALLGISRTRGLVVASVGLAVLLATGHGVLDEIHQSFIPRRTASALDVLADSTGALLGAWLCRWALTLWERHRQRPRESWSR